MVGNANGAHAKALAGSIAVNVSGCSVTNNRGSGLRIESGATFNVDGNVFDQTGERTDFTLTSTDTRTRYDINVLTGGKANVGTNKYV
jgi:parallel beta-helix repeat protein